MAFLLGVFVGEQVVRSPTVNVVTAVSFRSLQISQIHEPALIAR
jgi:hypothetical protein